MTLNEILFSGGTQLEKIRARQTAHACKARMHTHVMQSKHMLRDTNGNTFLFIVAQVIEGLDCAGTVLCTVFV